MHCANRARLARLELVSGGSCPTTWPHFWGIQILLLILILMYCTMRELARVIGDDKVRRMFFGSRQETQVS